MNFFQILKFFLNIKTYQTANFLQNSVRVIQRNSKLCDFPVHSVCFLQNFFFRSQQKLLSVLYHCAKFFKFSPSTFRDIFDRNINFAKFSRVKDRQICTCVSLVYSREHAQSAARPRAPRNYFEPPFENLASVYLLWPRTHAQSLFRHVSSDKVWWNLCMFK